MQGWTAKVSSSHLVQTAVTGLQHALGRCSAGDADCTMPQAACRVADAMAMRRRLARCPT